MNIYQLIRGHEALPERPFAMIVLSVEIIILKFFVVGNIIVKKVLFCCGLNAGNIIAGSGKCGLWVYCGYIEGLPICFIGSILHTSRCRESPAYLEINRSNGPPLFLSLSHLFDIEQLNQILSVYTVFEITAAILTLTYYSCSNICVQNRNKQT